jgi:hypothetical protein
MIYTDFEKFSAEVGILQTKDLDALGLDFHEPDTNLFDSNQATREKLRDFLAAHQHYHLATLTSDSDELEDDQVRRRYCEKSGKTEAQFDALCNASDDFYAPVRERMEIRVLTIDNDVRFVNRMGYYLCNGNADKKLFLEEIL